jgi:hypothetical protein
MSHRAELAAPVASRSFEPTMHLLNLPGDREEFLSDEIQRIMSTRPPAEDDLDLDIRSLELERRSLTPTRELDEADDDEPLETFGPPSGVQEKVQQLADSIFYHPPIHPESGDVLFVEFWERRGAFHYEELYDSCLDLHLAPFQLAARRQMFAHSINVTKELGDGRLGVVAQPVVEPFLHEPARIFLEKNLNDLEESLDLLRQNQMNSDYQLTLMFNSVIESINRLARMKLDAFGRADLLKEKMTLKSLGKQVSRAINSKDFGLLAQHEIIQRRQEGFQMFTQAIKMLQSGEDKPVLCPSLFRLATLQFRRIPSDFPDLPAKVLAQFYNEYESLLFSHRAYFSQAIIAHQNLYNETKDLIKQIDVDLQSC